MENIAIGIDIGTSNTKAAVFKDGRIQMVPNSIGDPSTPSIVQISDEGEVIGEETMMNNSDEKHTITEIKRLLGKNITDLKDLKRRNYDLIGDTDKLQIKVNRKGKDELFSPEQILALILKKLIKNASDFMETNITKAVITVPAYFDSKQISATEESAKLAGIEVLGIINEPTAAALAYGLGTNENLSNSLRLSIMKEDNVKTRKVLVFDLGGGSFDISILIIENTEFTVKAKLGDNSLGGIDFDYKLIDFCIKDFCQKMNINENDVRKDLNAIRRLKLQCIKAKKQLSIKDSTNINIYNFFNNSDLYIEITREKFNEECEDFYQKIKNIIDKVLTESNFTGDIIDDVIMVGGGSKIPKIREILEEKFDPNKIRDKINQDEAVVIGATWKAHKLIKNDKSLKILEIVPSTLGVGAVSKINDERAIGLIMSVLIEKNKPLPAKSEVREYKTIKDNQSFFKIKIYSGEDRYIKNNRLLGVVIVDKLPRGEKGSVILSISFDVDKNGILTIIAEVKSIGKKITEKYSIYSNDDNNKGGKATKIQSPTIINLNNNPESKRQLEEIKNLSKIIDQKKEELSLSNDDNKINILKELCEKCSNIINIYENLRKKNEDSENLYEKLFYYTNLLLKSYTEMIILDKEDSNTDELINKINEELSKYINDNIENLLDAFVGLKKEKPNDYIKIILYVVENLYKEGDKFLKEMKKYARYNSKKLYQKAEKIKKYIDDDLIKEMNSRLKNQYDDIQNNYGKKIEEIDSFAYLIKNQIEEKDTKFIPNKTGATIFKKKISDILKNENILELLNIDDPENVRLMVDVFNEMKNSLSKKGEYTEAEAYCIANIIKINFIIFKNYDFNLYEKLKNRISFIEDRTDIDTKQGWYKELEKLYEQIEEKKEEIENEKNKNDEKIQKAIDDIKSVFDSKKKDKKPKEFLEFLIENYPFSKCNSSKKESLKQKSFKDIFDEIFGLYHPDNYRDRDDYQIYHEIYILLVEIEEKFIKKIE